MRSRNYWLSDRISAFTATLKVAPVDGPINNWVCSLMEIILTIENENYYYFYWTDSVFLNGWLTVSETANCLTDLVECFSDSVIDWWLHSSCLNDSETIKLIDIIGRLIIWCAHWLKLNWPFQRKNFVAGLTVFLNGWLHVTASETARCLTDLMKCIIYWLSCWLTSTDLATVWMAQELWNWWPLLLHWLFGSVVFFYGLSVGFDGWLNASEAVNCLTDLVESLMTHWLTDNWLSDHLSDSGTFRVIDLITRLIMWLRG